MNAMTELKNLRFPLTMADSSNPKYRQLNVEYDPNTRSVWSYISPSGTACFNLGVLSDLRDNDRHFEKNQGKVLYAGELAPVEYFQLWRRLGIIRPTYQVA
jgi:DSF synthase